ncbi:hypothetical protein OIO90_002353 [Microbotryomycetes sp. JL221]|nr:hypothetical protein OIO90_002353 [Microbotryomycetes sp. JL221]
MSQRWKESLRMRHGTDTVLILTRTYFEDCEWQLERWQQDQESKNWIPSRLSALVEEATERSEALEAAIFEQNSNHIKPAIVRFTSAVDSLREFVSEGLAKLHRDMQKMKYHIDFCLKHVDPDAFDVRHERKVSESLMSVQNWMSEDIGAAHQHEDAVAPNMDNFRQAFLAVTLGCIVLHIAVAFIKRECFDLVKKINFDPADNPSWINRVNDLYEMHEKASDTAIEHALWSSSITSELVEKAQLLYNDLEKHLKSIFPESELSSLQRDLQARLPQSPQLISLDQLVSDLTFEMQTLQFDTDLTCEYSVLLIGL